jgi:hypothetical protein
MVVGKPIISASGRIDFVFEAEDRKNIAIEFKIGGHPDTYVGDLNKLAVIDYKKFERVFCAL